MTSMVFSLLLALAPISIGASVGTIDGEQKAASTRLDDGLLDPKWFGEGVAFTEAKGIDYVWIKPGLNLTGKTIHIKVWEDPIVPKRGLFGRHEKTAKIHTKNFPPKLQKALAQVLEGRAKISESEGDAVLIGRFVAAKAQSGYSFGIGGGGLEISSESATWDLKITDAKTGEPLLALHHRVFGINIPIELRLSQWANHFAAFVVDKALK